MADGVDEAGVVVGCAFSDRGSVATRLVMTARSCSRLSSAARRRAPRTSTTDVVDGYARVGGSTRAALWAGRGALVLNVKDGETAATAINDSGTAVGWAEGSDGSKRAVAWSTSH
jgi:hypothetical protein